MLGDACGARRSAEERREKERKKRKEMGLLAGEGKWENCGGLGREDG